MENYYLDLFKEMFRLEKENYTGEVPFYGRDKEGQWIDSLRYSHIAPAVLNYKNKTRGRHNKNLLRDSAVKIYRFALDRSENREQAKKEAVMQQEFSYVKDWKDIDRWQYNDALEMTTWYLMFGCGANASLIENILGSLGLHEKSRREYINSALSKSPKRFMEN